MDSYKFFEKHPEATVEASNEVTGEKVELPPLILRKMVTEMMNYILEKELWKEPANTHSPITNWDSHNDCPNPT